MSTCSGAYWRRNVAASPSISETFSLLTEKAVKLLALSETNGTELRNCPPYIREWVTRERAETDGRPSKQGLEGSEEIEDA
jgi:hypothetical protein